MIRTFSSEVVYCCLYPVVSLTLCKCLKSYFPVDVISFYVAMAVPNKKIKQRKKWCATVRFLMLIQVYFRHAKLWHSKPVIQYKCINITIRVPRTVHTERTTHSYLAVYHNLMKVRDPGSSLDSEHESVQFIFNTEAKQHITYDCREASLWSMYVHTWTLNVDVNSVWNQLIHFPTVSNVQCWYLENRKKTQPTLCCRYSTNQSGRWQHHKLTIKLEVHWWFFYILSEEIISLGGLISNLQILCLIFVFLDDTDMFRRTLL